MLLLNKEIKHWIYRRVLRLRRMSPIHFQQILIAVSRYTRLKSWFYLSLVWSIHVAALFTIFFTRNDEARKQWKLYDLDSSCILGMLSTAATKTVCVCCLVAPIIILLLCFAFDCSCPHNARNRWVMWSTPHKCIKRYDWNVHRIFLLARF